MHAEGGLHTKCPKLIRQDTILSFTSSLQLGKAYSLNTLISAPVEAGFNIYHGVISKLSGSKKKKYIVLGLNVCLTLSGSNRWGQGHSNWKRGEFCGRSKRKHLPQMPFW